MTLVAELGRAALLILFGLAAYALIAGGWAACAGRRRLALSAQDALVNLIWLGGFVFLVGSLIALWPDAREQRGLAKRYEPWRASAEAWEPSPS